MKTTPRLAAGLVLLGLAPAFASDAPAPSDVSYDEYGAVTASLTGSAGSAEDGAKVVSTKSMGNCVACHQISAMPDVSFQGNVGPSLDGVGERWSEAELRGIVANAKHTFPGTIMPAFYKNEDYVRPGNAFTGKAAEGQLDPLLSAQQVEDVVAYLTTLKE